MTSHIVIGNYEFRYVHRVEVKSSWKTLADTAIIEMPNVQGVLDKKVKPGQEVLIRLGYDDVLAEEFRGFVSSVSPKTPMRIECMDEMWKLRQEVVSHSWRSVTLKDVLTFLAPSAVVNVPEVVLNPFRLDKVTRYEALELVKEQYGLAVFFRGPELYVGLPYGIDEEPFRWKYHFQKNVAQFGSLEYRRKDDVRVKVKAISVQPNNSRIEETLGDSDGEQHTLHFYNLSKAELKQQAEQKMALLKFDGYKGSYTAFGQPLAQHSGIVELEDGMNPERGGKYYVDEVTTTYGPDGYRREISPGKMAADE